MFKHLLIPLDTSRFAEAALPYAQTLAENFDGKMTLVCVIEHPLYFGDEFTSTMELEAAAYESALADARQYFKGVVTTLHKQGYDVDYAIIEGRQAADAILKTAVSVAADAIVMSTHGRSGLGRWLLGSVADKILRHASIPVLLTRPKEDSPAFVWHVDNEAEAIA